MQDTSNIKQYNLFIIVCKVDKQNETLQLAFYYTLILATAL